MATLGQVAFRGNAQAFEYLINRTARNPLGELRWFSQGITRQLGQELASLLLRVADEKSKEYQTYLSRRYSAVREFLGEPPRESGSRAEVRLVEYEPESETKILAGIVFQQKHGGWDDAFNRVKALDDAGKRELFERYLSQRSARWQKVGRAFENAYVRFEI